MTTATPSLLTLYARKYEAPEPLILPRFKRAEHDFYPTPPEATRALLSVESFDGSIWDPACGDGAIARVLQREGHQVVCTDLIARGYGIGGIDFLEERKPRAKHIVTNPPYGKGLADDFLTHALRMTSMTGGTVAMLMNLSSLCHRTRHDLWTTRTPAAVYAVDELICWPNGDPNQAGYRTAQHRYAWMIWKPDHKGPAKLWWLAASRFRKPEQKGH